MARPEDVRGKHFFRPLAEKTLRLTAHFQAMFDILEADIVVMQETKIQRKDLRDDMVLVPGWDCYFSLPKYKKGLFFFRQGLEDRYSHGKHTKKCLGI